MKDNIYFKTINKFSRLKTSKENEAIKRREEVIKKIPRIGEINNELSKIGFELAKSISIDQQNDEKIIEKYKQKTIDLNHEKSEILVSKGFPIDYLNIKYNCNICKDEGFIENKPCRCFTQSLINQYYMQSNLADILNIENFDTFNLDYYDDDTNKYHVSPRLNMQNILLKSINYTKNFDSENINLYLFGNPGLGKTFLSHCIAKELLDRGKIVIYQTATDLIDIIRKNKFINNTNDNPIDYLHNCDLLIIDDLGTENLTDFANNELFSLVNKRLINNKKIIISTNLSIKELQVRYNNRLTSRILGNFAMLEFVGNDIRLKKAKYI